ncbi:MAG: hypothetical protein PVJ39_12215 [Gammaproteobacteria bacterium]
MKPQFVNLQMRRLLLLAALLVLCAPLSAYCDPQLESDTEIATAGYYRLQWNNGQQDDSQTADFILQESQHPSFNQPKVLYEGPDTARVVSGRADGDYFYRVAVDNGDGQKSWSDVIRVQVKHHPLSRAFMFFTIGAIVFLSTLIAIIHGNRTTSTKE